MNERIYSCFPTVQLLLCLFVFSLLGCGSLKRVEAKALERTESILQLAVNENDFLVFNQRVQALGLVAVDFREAITNVSGGDHNELWITFRFPNEDTLRRSYVMVMSYGFARRISYPYQ